MALSFSEGSIGGDIERISLSRLEAFYGENQVRRQVAAISDWPEEPRGSNGFAIAPTNSASGHALFLINPHTSSSSEPKYTWSVRKASMPMGQ